MTAEFDKKYMVNISDMIITLVYLFIDCKSCVQTNESYWCLMEPLQKHLFE